MCAQPLAAVVLAALYSTADAPAATDLAPAGAPAPAPSPSTGVTPTPAAGAPPSLASRPIPAVAAALAIVPGAGHYYLGEYAEGTALGASTAGLVGAGLLIDQRTGTKTIGRHNLVTVGMNLYMYQLFDAYRDARLLRGNEGYRYGIDDHSYAQLITSPLNPSVMSRWQVWVPTLAVSTLSVVSVVASADRSRALGQPGRTDNLLGRPVDPAVAYAGGTAANAVKYAHVGLGEEAVFRGFAQSALVEQVGPWAAIPLQAALFSAFHFPAYGGDGPAYAKAFLAGLIFGWQYHTTTDLRVSIATHAWIDFLTSVVEHAVDPARNPLGVEVAFVF